MGKMITYNNIEKTLAFDNSCPSAKKKKIIDSQSNWTVMKKIRQNEIYHF